MKRVLIPVLALFLAAATCVMGQETQTTKSKASQQASAAKEVTLRGTISEDGKSFTSDKDHKTLTLVNPEAVQGHAGHHVALTGHLMGDQIHVMSIKMMPAAKAKKGAAPKE